MRRRVSKHRPRRFPASGGYLHVSRSRGTASADDLGLLIAQTSDLLSVIDDQGCFAYASPSFQRILGIDPSRLVGTPAAALFHPSDLALWRTSDELAVAPVTIRHRHADGSWRWIELQRDACIRAGSHYSVQVGRDVSERFHTETCGQYDPALLDQAAQPRSHYLQMLSDATHVFAEVSLDLSALLDRIVRHVTAVLGDVCVLALLSDEGAWLKPTAVFIPAALNSAHAVDEGEIVRAVEGLIEQVIQAGKTMRLSAPIDQPRASLDEQYLAGIVQYGLYSALAVPLRNQSQIIGTLFLARGKQPYTEDDQYVLEDIADRAVLAIGSTRLYAAERQARHAAEHAAARTGQLQAVTAALAEALTPAQVADVIVREGVKALGADAGSIFSLSDDGSSLELLSYVGYPHELQPVHARVSATVESPLNEAIRLHDLVVAETPEVLIRRWPRLASAQAITGDAAVAAAPLLVDHKVLGVIYMAFRAPRDFHAEDRAFLTTLARQCAQAFERSRLYAAEQQARSAAQEAVHLRDAFLSIASHELKTPVTALLGYAELLQRRALQSGLQERDLRSIRTINEQARRLSNLISSLLDISRIETGQLQLDPGPLDLGALVLEMVSEMEPVFDQYTFVCDIPADALIINGDAVRLEQVLHNLFQNALRYSPAGGTITIRLRRQAASVRLTVTDQGIGIPASALPHIFQRFYRAHTGNTYQISGLGIGLYVVKEIVALHGGSVEVESAEGMGSAFSVELPLVQQEPNSSG